MRQGKVFKILIKKHHLSDRFIDRASRTPGFHTVSPVRGDR